MWRSKVLDINPDGVQLGLPTFLGPPSTASACCRYKVQYHLGQLNAGHDPTASNVASSAKRLAAHGIFQVQADRWQ